VIIDLKVTSLCELPAKIWVYLAPAKYFSLRSGRYQRPLQG
jgi:hypothetical protein